MEKTYLATQNDLSNMSAQTSNQFQSIIDWCTNFSTFFTSVK